LRPASGTQAKLRAYAGAQTGFPRQFRARRSDQSPSVTLRIGGRGVSAAISSGYYPLLFGSTSLKLDCRCRLILSQALINHLPQETIVGPGEEGHFHDKLRPDPMDPLQFKRATKAASPTAYRARRPCGCRALQYSSHRGVRDCALAVGTAAQKAMSAPQVRG
jgi:hypothetical protein